MKYRGIFLNDEAPDLTSLDSGKVRQRARAIAEDGELRSERFYTNLFEVIFEAEEEIIFGRRCGTMPLTRTIQNNPSARR